MRHKKAGIKIGRTSSHRDAMFRNMVTSLLKHDRIHTTDVKAKELRRWVEKVITLAKRGDLHARRQALAIVREKDVVHKLFEQVQTRFGQLKGGYSRIVKIGTRPGDAAPISLIELIAAEPQSKKSKKKKAPAVKKESLPTSASAAPAAEPTPPVGAAKSPEEPAVQAAADDAAGAAPDAQEQPEVAPPSAENEDKKE